MKIGCPHSCPFGFLCKPSGFLCLPRSFEPLFSISDRIYYYCPQLSFFQTVRKDLGPKGVVLVIIGNHDDRIFILESIIQIAVDINVKVFQFGISCLKVTQLCHKCQSWCSRKQPEKKMVANKNRINSNGKSTASSSLENERKLNTVILYLVVY